MIMLCILVIFGGIVYYIIKYKYYYLKWNIKSEYIKFQIKAGKKRMKYLRQTVRTGFDFFLFWTLFLWKDGYLWKKICSIILKFQKYVQKLWLIILEILNKIKDFLFYITPFARKEAAEGKIVFLLVIDTILVLIFLLAYISISLDHCVRHPVIGTCLDIIAAYGVWYIGYALSMLIAKIPIYFECLASIAMVGAEGVVGIVIAFLLVFIFEEGIEAKK